MLMPEAPIRSTAGRDLLLAIPFAFALRLGYLILSGRVIDMADAIHYINMAKGFAGGDFVNFDENLPVLYSILGALGFLAAEDWEWAFWGVSLASSTLLVVPIYFLAEELHGGRTARISVFFVGCWPWLVDYGSRIAPEALAVTLWFGAVWLLYRGIQGSRWALAFAPLAFFALHLTRPEGTFLMLGSPLAGLILCYGQDRGHWVRLGVHTLIVGVLTAGYAYAMQEIVGTATVSYRAPMSGDLLDYFRRGAVPLAETFIELSFNVIPIMLGPFLLMFFGVGFFRYSDSARKPRLEAFILFFCLLQWAMALANFSPAPRYLMTVIVAFSLWSCKGVELLQHRGFYWRRHRWMRFLPVSIIGVSFLLGMADPIARQYLGAMSATPVEYKVAGRWMAENLEPGVIFCRKPQVGYYADMPTIGPDVSHSPVELVDLAKEHGIRYFVYDKRYSADILPGLRSMLDTSVEHEHYQLLKGDLSENPDTQIVIYEFVPPGIEYVSAEEFPGTSSHRGPDQKRRVAAEHSPAGK